MSPKPDLPDGPFRRELARSLLGTGHLAATALQHAEERHLSHIFLQGGGLSRRQIDRCHLRFNAPESTGLAVVLRRLHRLIAALQIRHHL